MRELTDKKRKEKATPDQMAAVKARLAEYEQDGAWIEIKHELNAGESQNVYGRMVKKMEPGATELEPREVAIAKMAEYILDWNLVGSSGNVEPFNDDALRNLDLDTFNDINAAIQAHEETLQKEKEARKNGQGIAIAS